ncbi:MULTISPECIES: polyprenyl synthetase family protein [unclassified Streptomyces]|uniref:polyprenyl synthetase family protein n=1 Tax=unclassified Streptomyces TaxID=2593676 RepID=UPI00109E863E|nr:polyprenyl synthetase family protein [Streptomyces sp. A1136]THA54605.1 hypothetical protein E6R62_15615 [Streptomyces sp. A1136]
MTNDRPARPTATPAVLRDRVLERAEARIGGLLAEEHGHWAVEDRHAAALVSDIAAVVRTAGDRVRPVLFLTGYLAAGGDPESGHAVDAAAALEFLDAALSIRTDTREGTALRRGLPTLHVSHAAEHERSGWRGESRRFGEGTAVLAGDLAVSYADRLAAGLPEAARQVWDRLRVERVLGIHAAVAAGAAYQDDPWPGPCLTGGCRRGCAAGWYAVRHPLLLGAALAGTPELSPYYRDFATRLHAAWRLRGFLAGGPEFGDEAALLRDVLFDARSRAGAERRIGELAAEAARVLARAPLADHWRTDLTAHTRLLTDCA